MSDVGDIANAIGKFVSFMLQPQSTTLFSAQITTLGDAPLDMTSFAPLSPTAAQQPPVSMADRAHQQIAALQQVDPDFNELQFLGQAATQYGAALAAESTMNPQAFEGIATPNFIAWFGQRVTDWKNAGLVCVVKDIKMSGSTIIKVTIDATVQSVMVRFTGSGVRAVQDAASGAAVQGSLQSDSFTEFGTFVRPAGTTTPKAAAAGGATHCPSCGAPTVAGAATCPFCGTALTGTGSTWLLDKLSVSAYT